MGFPVYLSPTAGRFRILWDNRADAETTVETVSSAAAEFPASNLKNIWASYAWRTASLASPDYIKWDLGSPKWVSHLVIWNHNISAGATIRLQGNNADAWGAPSFDQAVDWNADYLILILSAAVQLRYWRLIITDTSNPAGYISIACRYLGEAYQPAYNPTSINADLIDPSDVGQGDHGQIVAHQRDVYLGHQYEFPSLPPADQNQFVTIYRAIGMHRPYYVIEDSDYPKTTTYYVLNVSLWQLRSIGGGWRGLRIAADDMR